MSEKREQFKANANADVSSQRWTRNRFWRRRPNVINSKVSAHFGLLVALPNVLGGTETIVYVTFRANQRFLLFRAILVHRYVLRSV